MLIYKQYDQAALDRQYNNRLQVPGFAVHLQSWKSLSQLAEKENLVDSDISYGSLQREKLDIYPSRGPSSKTLIFIHGGYWQKFDKTDFKFIANAFKAYGVTTVIINYPLAPAATVDQIVASCRRAVQWLHSHIADYSGNPDQLYFAGHSAGGQLAAMLMATDWRQFGNSNDIIKGVAVMSGIFNLTPIRLCYLNEVLDMDIAMANRNSPAQLSPNANCPLAIAVGSEETAEFMDQSEELYTSWKEIIPVKLIPIKRVNHFSILETMLDPESSLHQAICRIMKI